MVCIVRVWILAGMLWHFMNTVGLSTFAPGGINGYDSKKRWDAGGGRERRSCDRLTFFLSRIPSKTINLFYDNWQKVMHLASLIS